MLIGANRELNYLVDARAHTNNAVICLRTCTRYSDIYNRQGRELNISEFGESALRECIRGTFPEPYGKKRRASDRGFRVFLRRDFSLDYLLGQRQNEVSTRHGVLMYFPFRGCASDWSVTRGNDAPMYRGTNFSISDSENRSNPSLEFYFKWKRGNYS